ncbi:ABC transporter permease [Paenibacillus woosongensis]|uniref:FtsX-like permease family protein n=1 Tax=Paenibacillus woosongensis TaxID=307580 RepID=A0A7X2Z500_9BACL|nr:ABC transporter permease [Paenibacillus woosongensis]MUG47634.1 FtsX-like permease family protein [Paenibacillus woosongensis]
MRISDLTRLSWDQVRRRKVVTMLCAAGLSIGCAAIILAMSIGESTQQIVESELNSFLKMDEITVMPNSGAMPGQDNPDQASEEANNRGLLTDQKLEVMRNMKHVTAVAPYQTFDHLAMTTADSKEGYVEVVATDLTRLKDFGETFAQGKADSVDINSVVLSYGATMGLMDEETRNKLYEAMERSGYDRSSQEQYRNMMVIPTAMYQTQIQLVKYDENGKQLTSAPLQVIGVLKKPKGRSDISIAQDSKIYISIETAEQLRKELMPSSVQSSTPTYNSVKVKVDAEQNVKQVEEQLQRLTVSTQSNLLQKEQLEEQFAVFKAIAIGAGVFILIIASISIIVAMTMSTYQRRRQIGIMKVLGANLSQIRNMFIVEAALLGFLGGLLGIMFSYWIVWGINALILSLNSGESDISIFIPYTAIPVGLAFAIMTGIISGIYPAVSASRTDALTAIKRD